jgi:2-dehydropantoate 2-reductase
MQTLIVGAGAVGQVLGAHLARGGASVSLLVKEKYAAEAKQGFTLQPLHGKKTPLRFTPDEVLTSPAAAAGRRWDLIVLCVSSTALKNGEWLKELAAAPGLFVAIQPGLEDPAYAAARVGAERLVWGMFPLVSFPDGKVMSYYLPPLGKLPFSGPRAREMVDALNAGGLPSRVDADVPSAIAFSGPLLEMLIIALECAGWRFSDIGPHLGGALAGMRETLAVAARHTGKKAPFMLRMIRPWMIRLALPLLKLAPFSFENYLRAHFTKVGDQTEAELDTWIRRAGEYQLPSSALSGLRGRLSDTRQSRLSA